MDLDNCICVITGSPSGIAAACARAIAAKSAKVVVTDINEGDAKQVADDINGLAISCNICFEKGVTNLVSRVEPQVGDIYLRFNNPGLDCGVDLLTTPLDFWQSQ